MSTITRERLKYLQKYPEAASKAEALELIEIALASLEAEPVGYMNRFTGRVFTLDEQPGADTDVHVYAPVYTSHPAQVKTVEPVTFSRETNDQIAAVMLRYGTLEQKAEALSYAGASQAGHISVPDESAVELLATDLMKRIDRITGERHSVATLSSLRVSIVEACRAAMLQGADGALTNEDTKRVDELVMWIKRLAHSLRKANPDSKLQSDAMDYLSRKGLIGVKDILR